MAAAGGCSVGASAQSVPADVAAVGNAEVLLGSGEPRLVAWGALEALADRDESLMPQLLSLADQWQPMTRVKRDEEHPEGFLREDLDRRDAMEAVLDALIGLGAQVPATTVRLVAADFGNTAAVMLSRLPVEEAAKLGAELYRMKGDHVYALQYVSASLAARSPVAGFAAGLLRGTEVQAAIYLVNVGTGPVSSNSIGDCFDRPPAAHPGWPKTGQYRLLSEGSSSELLLVKAGDGVSAIYADRVEADRYNGCGMSMGMALTAGRRLELIGQMLGEPAKWRTAPERTIEVESAMQLNAELMDFIGGEEGKHVATLKALEAKGLVSPEEAADAMPRMQVRVQEMRRDRSIAYVKPAGSPADVEWCQAARGECGAK
jgi:hypothetical protein